MDKHSSLLWIGPCIADCWFWISILTFSQKQTSLYFKRQSEEFKANLHILIDISFKRIKNWKTFFQLSDFVYVFIFPEPVFLKIPPFYKTFYILIVRFQGPML
jgi:hypothetical protein